MTRNMAEHRRFSPSAGWDEVRGIAARESRLLTALAGVFFLLPGIAVDLFGPRTEATTFAEFVAAFEPYIPFFILVSLVQIVGQIAIWALILAPERPTVGEAIRRGFVLLPFYFLVYLCTNLMIFVGLLFLIVPGLYLATRVAPVGPVFVAENERWPAGAIGRSFAVTRGNAFPIFAFLLIVGIVFLVLLLVTTMVIGTLLPLLGLDMAPGGAGAAILGIVTGIVSAAGTTVFTLMPIAIYRQLAGDPAAPTVFR